MSYRNLFDARVNVFKADCMWKNRKYTSTDDAAYIARYAAETILDVSFELGGLAALFYGFKSESAHHSTVANFEGVGKILERLASSLADTSETLDSAAPEVPGLVSGSTIREMRSQIRNGSLATDLAASLEPKQLDDLILELGRLSVARVSPARAD